MEGGQEDQTARGLGQRFAGVLALITGALFAVSALLLVASVVVITPFFIPSAKMTPTFSEGATIWAIRSNGDSVQRNDLIVMRRPDGAQQTTGRVVALGGDTVAISNCKLVVNGQPADEPFLRSAECTRPGTNPRNGEPITVPQGSVYELGDNRNNSRDSRFLGPLPTSSVTHRIVLTAGPSRTVLVLGTAVLGLVAVVCFFAWRGDGAPGSPS